WKIIQEAQERRGWWRWLQGAQEVQEAQEQRNGGGGSKKRRRAELVNTKLPDARNIDILSVTHLVLEDNLLLPFQKAILEACPHLEQLEICYSQKADGGKVATLVRDNCRKLRRLTLKSTRQSWTLEMIDKNTLVIRKRTVGRGDPQAGQALKSPLFDIALLDHVKELPHLSEVIITEVKYRKKLYQSADRRTHWPRLGHLPLSL
ncbi:hypothetical protein BGX30_003818, partial [Mortierella sp. GBA39]